MKQFHELIPYLTLFAVLLTFCYLFIATQEVSQRLDRIEARMVQTV